MHRRTGIVVSLGSGTIAGTIHARGAHGDRAAFVEPSGGSTSYAETWRRVLALAEALSAAGIGPGDIVGFVSPRSPLGLIGFLAISSVAVCCPLSARQRPEELTAALESMGVSTLVDGCGDPSAVETARMMRLRVLECRASEQGIDVKTVGSDCEITPKDIGARPGLALVMRTSGTTSKPKLVGLSHANVIAAASAIRSAYDLGKEDLCFNLMPLYHVHGLNGMTETAATVCSNLPPPAKRKVGGVGSSIGAEIRIADEHGADVAQGGEGEILLKGPSVITGYLDSDDVNAKNFHGPWLRTGDVGYFDEDGDLFVVGRTKELIKRGGQSIYPSEIDNALSAHDDIADAIAFAIDHPTLGEDLVAAVVPKAGAVLREPELRAYLSSAVSTYKVPSAILIVDAIPKNEAGKVQRRELKPVFASHFLPVGEPAAGDVEAVVLDIWREILKRDDAGATDNVLVLGADPLRCGQAADIVRERLGWTITAKQIFRNPTVREQARFLSSTRSAISPRRGREDVPFETTRETMR